MIYVVAGHHRSGTSMMCAACKAGGMEVVSSPQRDQMQSVWGDEFYRPNPESLYEAPVYEWKRMRFPLDYEGKVIKVPDHFPIQMAVSESGYRVAVMRRSPQEIYASHSALLNLRQFQDRCRKFVSSYNTWFGNLTRHLENRRDVVSMDILDYQDAVSEPYSAFLALKKSQWPFDLWKAAEVVNRRYHRFVEGKTA